MHSRPFVVGVAGGSGSGKTTVVEQIIQALGTPDVTVLHHDAYYRDRSDLTPEQRQAINYDHPDSLENALMIAHLEALLRREPVQVPVYDFSHHARLTQTERLEPAEIVIVEGILVFQDARLRELMDLRLFVETDADVRFIRRLRRDLEERGRTLGSVVRQYLETVRPMYLEFVEPSKRYADVIIPEGGFNTVAIDLVVTKLREMLRASRQG
ncbi:MAG: uridine kinase [Chloroflexi bacterium]|nr:uridine kinase [Chloroflexota bacterium]